MRALVTLVLAACSVADPTAESGAATNAGPGAVTIWDDAASCWTTKLVDPAPGWVGCAKVDTGDPWAYELRSDADGDCLRVPIGCDGADVLAPCDAVAECCDPARLTASDCG